MNPEAWWNLVERGGVIGILLIFFFLFYSGKIRLGRDYDKIETSYDKLLEANLRQSGVAEKSIVMAEEDRLRIHNLEAKIDTLVARAAKRK